MIYRETNFKWSRTFLSTDLKYNLHPQEPWEPQLFPLSGAEYVDLLAEEETAPGWIDSISSSHLSNAAAPISPYLKSCSQVVQHCPLVDKEHSSCLFTWELGFEILFAKKSNSIILYEMIYLNSTSTQHKDVGVISMDLLCFLFHVDKQLARIWKSMSSVYFIDKCIYTFTIFFLLLSESMSQNVKKLENWRHFMEWTWTLKLGLLLGCCFNWSICL